MSAPMVAVVTPDVAAPEDNSSEISPLGDDWRDGLDPWQVELADSLDELVEQMGRIPTTDAAYTDASPYIGSGNTCANCVACGDNNSCDWVAVTCNPSGWCKFNIVPVLIQASAEADTYYKSRRKKDEDDPFEDEERYENDEDSSDDDDSDDSDVEKDYGPGVGGVHVDSPDWSGGKKMRTRKPKNMTVLAEAVPEVMQDANLMQKSSEIPNQIQKSDEKRYTLGPWYVPNRSDAHGEWTDPEELQKALWGYVENGDRDIRLQHNVNIVAGKWVEALTWPHPIEVPMLQADTGQITKTAFPAGTVFLGVQWEPWAWELVKKGEIRGYSIGGTGSGVEVDLPTDEQTLKNFPTLGK